MISVSHIDEYVILNHSRKSFSKRGRSRFCPVVRNFRLSDPEKGGMIAVSDHRSRVQQSYHGKTMKYFLVTLAFGAVTNSISVAQTGDDLDHPTVAPQDPETKYRVDHLTAGSRFMTSIERSGPCKLRGLPLTKEIRVPSELYPKESMEQHEEGTATIQLIFDSDWCVRKATITQSSGFWRLDNVSLWFAMTIKFTPKITAMTVDAEPTITIPIAWGESQRKRR